MTLFELDELLHHRVELLIGDLGVSRSVAIIEPLNLATKLGDATAGLGAIAHSSVGDVLAIPVRQGRRALKERLLPCSAPRPWGASLPPLVSATQQLCNAVALLEELCLCSVHAVSAEVVDVEISDDLVEATRTGDGEGVHDSLLDAVGISG